RRLDRHEVGVISGRLDLPRPREPMALVEYAHCRSTIQLYSHPCSRYQAAVAASPSGTAIRASNLVSLRSVSVSHNQPGASSSLAFSLLNIVAPPPIFAAHSLSAAAAITVGRGMRTMRTPRPTAFAMC